jgi:hypothetical protein
MESAKYGYHHCALSSQSDAEFSGPRAGAMLGVEQPLFARFKAVADWMSGRNGFGYFTPGVRFTFAGGQPPARRLQLRTREAPIRPTSEVLTRDR